MLNTNSFFLPLLGGTEMGAVAIASNVLLHISVAIKASFLKFNVLYIQKQYF